MESYLRERVWETKFFEFEYFFFLVLSKCFSFHLILTLTYPRWERDSRLMRQKIQGWAWYGQLMTDGMNYIHVKFRDLQQKRTGVRVEVEN